jgi:hypothetical protein
MPQQASHKAAQFIHPGVKNPAGKYPRRQDRFDDFDFGRRKDEGRYSRYAFLTRE